MTTTYDMAMYLARHGIYYYPTPYNTKAGLPGTNGLKDAVNDDSKAQEWFQGTNNNIGINLKKSHLMVVDVDMGHDSGIDGRHNLLEVFKQCGRLPDDTLIEKTPHGGIHYFFKLPDGMDIKTEVGAFFDNSGIDLMTNNVLISPSTIDGQPYTLVSGSYEDIKPVPQWLPSYMQRADSRSIDIKYTTTKNKHYTGKLIDKLMAGTTTGSRNSYFTSIIGSMLHQGAEPESVLMMIQLINDNCLNMPLPDNELRTIFRSVLNRERRRIEVN